MTVGLVSVAVGVIGIFVPLLPTTVFLLIGAACFARSSDRLHDWLLGHRWLGPYIRNYREHRGITQRARVLNLVALWVVIGYSALFAASTPWLRLLLAAIAVGVSLHLLSLRTMTPELTAGAETAAPGHEPPGADR
jgi:uncharacterized membrane protein YbaN (DUF454 family)